MLLIYLICFIFIEFVDFFERDNLMISEVVRILNFIRNGGRSIFVIWNILFNWLFLMYE